MLTPAPLVASLPTAGVGNVASSSGASTLTVTSSIPATASVVGASASSGSSVSSSLSTLFPWLSPPVTKSDPSLVYTGEALPPVPKALVSKIISWQFVEMPELLPEYWPVARDDYNKRAATRRPKVIEDFHTWLQCFALYCGVLGSHHPAAIPELVAYLVTISRAKQDYEGRAWAHYDTFYRRNAAVTNNKRWSVINPSIYAQCFTGKASGTLRCELCRSPNHTTKICPTQEDVDVELPARLKAIESAIISLTKQEPANRPGPSQEVCRLYNNSNCRYKRCKYRHACAICTEPHPAVSCPKLRASSDTTATQFNRQARREANRPF